LKIFLTLALLLCFQISTAQTGPERISLSFENATLQEVLTEIQDTYGLKFYYVQDWVSTQRFSGSFKDTPLPEVLDTIFGETLLNYYFLREDRIVITRNNIIYDQLPQGFFPEVEETIAEEVVRPPSSYNPVFVPTEEQDLPTEMRTVRIGKESQSTAGRRFQLSGVVRDDATGDPIANLAVLVRDTDLGTVTDENGFYSLSLPAGVHFLQTRSMGNEDVQMRVVLYNSGELNFTLKEDYQMLGEIFLESNPDANVSDAVAGSDNIDVKEIKNIPLVLGERDIMKVAATLPGISTAGEGAAGYNVRGGKTDQNLILLDDAALYNPSHFFGIFSAINPFTTASVDIYKGHIPAQYGGRLSSVFDIRTKDATTEKFTGEVSVGPVTSNVTLEVPIVKEKSGLLVGGRGTYSDWILKSLDEKELKNSSASFYDLIAKYNHKFNDRTSIKATGYYSNDEFSITSDSLYNYNNRMFSLNLGHKFNEQHQGNLVLTNTQYNFNIDYDSDFNDNFTSGYSISDTELKLDLQYRHSPAHRFRYGLSSKLYSIDPGSIEPMGSESLVEALSIPQEKGVESALYITDDFEVSDKLLLNAGFRYSFYAALGEKEQKIYEEGLPKSEATVQETIQYGNNEVIETYSGPEVRLSARYLLLPDLSLKASYNNTLQYIHTLSNNTTVSPTDTYKLSDLHIEPQRATQYSLGLYKNLNENMYELSLEGYYKSLSNILDYKTGAQLFLNENIETEVLQGQGRSYGVELLMKKTEGKLNGWMGYTYSRSYIQLDGDFKEERVNNGEYFPSNYDRPHDFSMVANYKITHRFSFSANFMYQTGRPVTYPTGKYYENGSEYVLYSDRNKFRIPDYYRLDLSFNVEGNHRIKKFAHSFWNISVYNVLGRNNPYSVFFVTENGEVKAYKSSIFSIPVPTITYNFRF